MDESTKRNLVNYSSRDYESLVNEFWNLIPKLTELWTPADGQEVWKPESAADPGVILGKYLASVADMLGVNLDIIANELFAPSVSQRKNAEKLFSLIGYDLGWYTAARTEVTFKNAMSSSDDGSNSSNIITLDFGFNGSNFSTLTAHTDITNQSRVITYNILPLTSSYGSKETRSRRSVLTENLNIFTNSDIVHLKPGESVTRVAIEGELRSYSISVDQVKQNNYIIKLPSQHIDTTAIWIKAKTAEGIDLSTQWIQCSSAAEFIQPEARFAVSYDSYSNAQIQISNYLNQLEGYSGSSLTIYWIDCSGVIGCVGKDVLTDYLQANPNQSVTYDSGELQISNLSNTVELPHTNTVTGKSPETAKEAYFNSRNYINTWDSLVTLPDFNRFLNREPGVDCGLVIDCQKALDINLSIYNDSSLTDSQKSKQYLTNLDFPAGPDIFDWKSILNMSKDPTDKSDYKFAANFKNYTAMCYAIHNDFNDSDWGQGKLDKIQTSNVVNYIRYKPPAGFIQNVIRDYRPLQTMTVELEFGYLRLFTWYVVGQIYPKHSVTKDVANNIIKKVKEDLALYFAPANRSIGVKPTIMEVVDVIRNSHDLIDYFDSGSINNPVINWVDCDVDYFNAISFARYKDIGTNYDNIRISPEYLID